jgi:hypothetical protein
LSQNFYTHLSAGLSSLYRRNSGDQQEKHFPQWRLDTFCREYEIKPDALLIDVEGAAMDVLEGCGDLLNGVRLIYVEVNHPPLRDGVRDAEEVEAFLVARGFIRRTGPPAYRAGEQSNWTFVR